jgi:16S rRNA (guanine1207-N2)-methyltransferase
MPVKGEGANHYFVKHPKSQPKLGVIHTYLRGMPFEFTTASGVFSKKRVDQGTRLLIESMVLPRSGWALDIGCGYGAVGICAAVFNPHLHLVLMDVNERAVWLAKQNIKINGVENAEVKHSDLYKTAEGLTFDCILSNPPVSAGMETVKAIVTGAPKHMAGNALFEMVVRSKIAGKRLHMILEKTFGNVTVLARKSGYRVLVGEEHRLSNDTE